MERYAAAHPDLHASVMPGARRAWVQLCADGVAGSAAQYWRLHQAESAGHVHDLEQALAALQTMEHSRAEAWRRAAHDLRGSVTVVKGATNLLEGSGSTLPEPIRVEVAEMLSASVSSLHDMLNDLLSLARLEAGHEQRTLTHDATEIANEATEASTDRRHDIAPAATLPSASEALPQSQQAGEGVGLTIVKRLCELLDAGLELATEAGRGSTFRVILPRRYASPPAEAAWPAPRLVA